VAAAGEAKSNESERKAGESETRGEDEAKSKRGQISSIAHQKRKRHRDHRKRNNQQQRVKIIKITAKKKKNACRKARQ